jgi:hypothetical protein
MIIPQNPNGCKGHYLGTEIDEKWWKRHTRDKLFTHGNGEYRFDKNAFYFLRYLTKDPIEIHLRKIVRFEIGTTHVGRWLLKQRVLKLIWEKDGLILSSGFIVAGNQL